MFFNIGARYDQFSGSGVLETQKYSEFNPKAGVVLKLDTIGSFKLTYGKATRVPNGFETLSAVAILGDPNNTPERMQNLQFQWLKNWGGNLRTDLGFFNTQISNRLVTDANLSEELLANGFVGQFINIGDVTQSTMGINGSIHCRINKIGAMLNFTQLLRTNDGYGNEIAYIPFTMINARVNVPIHFINFNLGAQYRGTYSHPAEDPRDPVASRVIINMNVSTKFKDSPWRWYATINNLLNTKYYYPSSSLDFVNHFPARGIQLSTGLQYVF